MHYGTRSGRSAPLLYRETWFCETHRSVFWTGLALAHYCAERPAGNRDHPDEGRCQHDGRGESKGACRTSRQVSTWSYTVDDCRKTYEELLAKGVKFSSPPTE